MTIIFLITFRAFIAPRTTFDSFNLSSGWRLSMGFEQHLPDGNAIDEYFLFSILSLVIFLFKLWGLSLIYIRTHTQINTQDTINFLYHLSRPFNNISQKLRPGVLVGMGIMIALLLNTGGPTLVGTGDDTGILLQNPEINGVLILRCTITSLSALVSSLTILYQVVIFLIISSWVGMFTNHSGIIYFSQDWINLLMGPLRKHPIRIGMLDLSPFIFLFLIQIVESILQKILWISYKSMYASSFI